MLMTILSISRVLSMKSNPTINTGTSNPFFSDSVYEACERIETHCSPNVNDNGKDSKTSYDNYERISTRNDESGYSLSSNRKNTNIMITLPIPNTDHKAQSSKKY